MAQTVFDLGDTITSRLKLGVTPDGSTGVTVTVLKPDGSALYTAAAPDAGPVNTDEYSKQWTGNLVNDWVAVWTVTGTGAGVQAKVYNVRALPAATNTRPAWAPFLSDVADYIPRLTIDTTTPGSAIELGTFNGNTTPTDEQAQRLVDRAVASLVGTVGTVQSAAADLAKAAAALRAAAAIQRAYPRSNSDQAIADALDKRADAETAHLHVANAAAGAATPEALMPVYSFPPPVAWGDLTFL